MGVNLATHLYEFIREIRGRVDQYAAFFGQMKSYLASQQQAHPELRDYLAELEAMVAEAQSKSEEIYATPLSSVEKKTDAMKKLAGGKRRRVRLRRPRRQRHSWLAGRPLSPLQPAGDEARANGRA